MTPEEYLASKNFKVRPAPGQWQVQCPFCNDTNKFGHLYVNREHGAFLCHRCDERGSFRDLQVKLGDEPTPISVVWAEKQEVWGKFVDVCKDALLEDHPAAVDALTYLFNERGLKAETIEQYALGWVPRDVLDRLFEQGVRKGDLANAGLLNDQGSILFWDRILIPYWDAGRVVAMRAKKVGGNVIQAKDTSIRLFGVDQIRGRKEVFVAEGEFDAMFLSQLGYAACAIPGANSFQQHWVTHFDAARRVFVCLDADDAGRTGALKVLQSIGGRAKSIDFEVPEGETSTDITEFFLRDRNKKTDFDFLVDQVRGRRVYTLEEAFRERDRLFAEEDGIVTGWNDIDRAIRPGFLPGQVITVLAKTGAGKCHAADTLIPVEGGRVVTLGSLREGAEGGFLPRVVSMGSDGRLELVQPSRFLVREPDEVFRMTLRSGKTIRATGDHKFFDGEQWVEMLSLKPGDMIATPRVLPNAGVGVIGDELRFVALHLSDGTSSTKLGYTKSDPVLRDMYVRLVGGDCRITSGDRAPSAYPRGESRLWAKDVLERYGLMGAKSRDKFIPDAVYELDDESLAEFMGLLFAGDGSVESNGSVSYTSSSEQMIRQVQHLLLRLGVVSFLRYKPSVDSWELAVVASCRGQFGATVGRFVVGEKGERPILPGTNSNVDVLPVNMYRFFEGHTQLSVMQDSDGSIMTSARLTGKRFGRESLAKWAATVGHSEAAAWATSDVFWDEVVSVEPDGFEETYCLQVDGNENFVADDIITHNTSFLSQILHHVSSWSSPDFPDEQGAGIPALVLSLEQTKSEFGERLRRIGSFYNPHATHSEIAKWHSQMRINDENRMPAKDVRLLVEEFIDDVGVPPKIIMVDYLGYFARSYSGSNYERVTDAVMELKALAKENGSIIMAPHQVSRLQRRGEKLDMDSARDSGVVEETSDFVFGLYRRKEYAEGEDVSWLELAEVQLHILKSRHGGVGEETSLLWAPYSLSLTARKPGPLFNRVETEWEMREYFAEYDSVLNVHRKEAQWHQKQLQ